MKRAIIFGLGMEYYMGLFQIKEEYEIVALTDNSEGARNWATEASVNSGLQVINPVDITDFEADVILITVLTVASAESITNQLSEMGLKREKIKIFHRKSVSPFLIDPRFYEPNLTYEEKKDLFANNVEHITIEPNSRCNRKCWFCPNSVLDRYTKNVSMEMGMFEKIINELEEIDYNGIISYSFYNEPLLDEDLERKIRYEKEHLPKSIPLVSTNGDYLTRERLQSLIDAGLEDMVISVYDKNDPNFEWTCEKAKNRVQDFIDKLELNASCVFKAEHTVYAFAQMGALNIRLQNHDFKYAAHNRGETLSDELPLVHVEKRTKFCSNSFVTFNVYHDGSVYTCGNRRNDVEKHKEFEMGNVANDNIFNIFHSEVATKFRKGFSSDFNNYPCRSCTYFGNTCIIQFPNIPVRDRPRYTRDCK